jgi:hypothetical protein
VFDTNTVDVSQKSKNIGRDGSVYLECLNSRWYIHGFIVSTNPIMYADNDEGT